MNITERQQTLDITDRFAEELRTFQQIFAGMISALSIKTNVGNLQDSALCGTNSGRSKQMLAILRTQQHEWFLGLGYVWVCVCVCFFFVREEVVGAISEVKTAD